ncbi:two-component sensor histidine kinase [Pseudoxanthomonas broegbernensis]|uniref:Two-component sensor histidine kinase n=1 Tax=Pseudoxanthomonas broegbernensis TaxID=83619 RepID=A0A7V8GN28_9GAMM|nr:sensor histidine kinase [Pseudoxanthomonas broegbernensis]KAF1686727.1 two-component sensor histidine kinase [Pseudoxanthomonas broegbernensis]MBB6063506.1 two-component system sensor histidine kinase DesK [Pseudoxanthomonas broegbernensis]
MSRSAFRWLPVAPDSLLASSQCQGRPAWSEAIHLLWTMWVFIVPVFTPQGYDATWWLLTALSYPVFVLLYAAALSSPLRWVPACALGMAALSLALLRWYPSGMSYFVFGCVFLGSGQWRSPWRYALSLLLLNLVFVGWARAIGFPWSAMLWMPLTTVVVGLLVYVDRMGRQKSAALRLSQEEVRRLAANAERERIGRDLHDLLGHTLSLVALKADLTGRLLHSDPAAARREIAELGQVARDALGQVRRAVTGIRAAGLAAELAAARLLLEGEGVSLQVEVEDAALPAEQETVLALCLREAVTNIHRHARATRVRVGLGGDAGGWRLHVEDDGRGGAIRPGNGLGGMRERLEMLGGSLRIEPAPRRGTRLLAELPHGHAAMAAVPPALP